MIINNINLMNSSSGSRPSRPWSAIPGYTGYRRDARRDNIWVYETGETKKDRGHWGGSL
jgi:hypothetical protein